MGCSAETQRLALYSRLDYRGMIVFRFPEPYFITFPEIKGEGEEYHYMQPLYQVKR